jgi:hypothetical protein
MSITLVGGLDRLRREYENAAQQIGINLTVYTGKESYLSDTIASQDLMILLTDMVSHNARIRVLQKSKRLGIPVHFLKSNGVSGLRRYLSTLVAEANA